MSLNINGAGLVPDPGHATAAATAGDRATARDVAAAARVGVQAVPVRNNDPVTATAKREKHGDDQSTSRSASADADRLDMLRFDGAQARRRRDHRAER